MRTFEILSCLLALLPILTLLFAAQRRVLVLLSLVPVIVAIGLHLAVEGGHWQLGPLYLAVLLVMICCLAGPRLWRWARITAAAFGLVLLAAAVGLSWMVPMFRLPKPTGQEAVGTQILHLVDPNRPETGGSSPSGKRELMVQAWYPAQPTGRDHLAVYQRRGEVTLRASYRSVLRTNSYMNAAVKQGGPYPVILYNPGWMGERTEGTFATEELASHGYVVVAIDHTFYGGLVEFPDGRVTDSSGAPEIGNFENSTVEEQWALGSRYVHLEADDDVSVLNELEAMNADPQSAWFHKLDMTRVAAMGFSIGGATASQIAYQDARIKGALNMDGWTFGDAGTYGLAKPWMVIYEDKKQTVPSAEELDSGPLPIQRMKHADMRDYSQVLKSMEGNGGYLLFVAGTRHVDFTDRSMFSPLSSRTGGGSVPPTRVHTIANAYAVAFFSHLFWERDEPLLRTTPSPFAEVEFRAFPIRDQ